MEKRTLVVVAISMGILFLWWKIFPPPVPAVQVKAPANVPAVLAPAGGTSASVSPAAALPSGPLIPEELVILETPRAKYVLSNVGADLRKVVLKDDKFLKTKGDKASGLDVVGAKPEGAPLQLSFPSGDFKLPDGLTWSVKSRSSTEVVFRTESEVVAVEKRVRVDGDGFRLAMDVQVENRTDKEQSHALAVHLYGEQDPSRKGGGFFAAASADLATLVCFVDGKVQRDAFESLWKEPSEKFGAVKWMAADTKYYAVALVPHREPQPLRCARRGLDAMRGEATLTYDVRKLGAKAKANYAMTVFAGPKVTEELDKVRPGGDDVQLDKVVDLTLAWLARPLIALLKFFQSVVGNWGFAIILLTFFVKLVTFYPTQRAMMSGKKMQRLQPKLALLKEKYGSDRQRMGVETMSLYKAEGVSPVGGCLPTLITMPIWFALFSALNYAVELHRTPFFGYIQDLSARDQYFVAPLLMGCIMFLQMRMSPAGTDPQQQKMMAVMMPIMFTGFSLFLPAGLAIYTLTNSLLAILQQVLINRLDRKNTLAAAAAIAT